MKRRALLAAALLLLACNRVPSRAPVEASETVLELRDGQGQPSFTLTRSGEGFRYLESNGTVGRVMAAEGGRFRIEDPQRGVLEAWSLEDGGVEIRGRGGTLLRLTREAGSWRLGDGGGIPVARVRLDSAAGEAVGHDAGGLVIVRVRVAGGRLVVSDREGRTRALITGKLEQLSLTKAALTALPALSAAERALLFIAAGA